MWGLTSEKVIAKINVIIDEMAPYDRRIREYEDQAKFYAQNFGASPESAVEVFEWRATYDEIYELLADARAGVRSGEVPFKEFAAQLPGLRNAVRHFGRVLDQTDAAAEAGKALARKRLGIRA